MEIFKHKINAIDLRRHLGEFINRIVLNKEEFTILRSGKPVARLVPFRTKAEYKLSEAAGMGQEVWEKTEAGEYVNHQRESWNSL